MRIDRTVTMLIASRHAGGEDHDGKIPILMYHSIGPAISTGLFRYFETSTSPRLFALHMELLRDLRYTVVRLKDLDDALSRKKRAGGKFAIITFDDGYADFYEAAFPVLRSFGFPATMFLPTAFIGFHGGGIEGKMHLSWPQIREMQPAGIDFGSHTVNHVQLANEADAEILRQLSDSKKAIEDGLGAAIDSFAYPFAFPETRKRRTDALRRFLLESGYRTGVCTSIGRASRGDDPFFLKRLPVNTFDDKDFFKAKLDGAYDWLHGPQVFFKLLKNMI